MSIRHALPAVLLPLLLAAPAAAQSGSGQDPALVRKLSSKLQSLVQPGSSGARPAAKPSPAPGGAPAPPAQDPDGEDWSAEVEAALAAALALPSEDAAFRPAVEELWRAVCRERGEARSLVEELGRRASAAAEAGADGARGLREVRALLMRRRGTLDLALAEVDRLIEQEAEPDWLLERARLLDATGRTGPAREAYRAALTAYEGRPEELDLRLRMALLGMGAEEESETALADFARGEDVAPELADRAAVVLALLGRPKEAIELYTVEGEGSARFRACIRVAEWALRAADTALASEWGWNALEAAQLDRDRYYALTVLIEAHRAADALDELVDRFASAEELSRPAREVWINLLRELDRFDEAAALFADDAAAQGFPVELRRELLEMDREAGREAEMVARYHELIQADPQRAAWPEGLARYHLENGDVPAARAAWQRFLTATPPGLALLDGARALMGLGQDDLAVASAERCIEAGPARYAAYLFLFDLARFRGDLAEAEAVLERMDAAAPPEAPERMQLAESFERIGNLRRAVDVLEGLRAVRGPQETGEDLEMRLAWLLSEVGEEELAMERWFELWRRVDSVPRRRYVEDRMMAVAARLGRLADLAIDIEKKLRAGTADDRESGLLVRLYTKVGDPVSATEVIEEHLAASGGSQVDALQEKARVFLACTDYHNYEKTVRQLIAVDPEGEGDYLRQIAMSMLERGKPDQARVVLARLEELGEGSDSAEFEAGVLALAGMREEAVRAYRRGIAQHTDRIESYLLLANLLRELGDTARAVGMFQHLAETADKDDLFTIAIDGLLNMEAPAEVLEWARRIVLERLARRHDKMYLYQLLADLAEQTNDREAWLIALEGSLPIAGDRRPSVVRELMDLAQGGRSAFGGPRQPEQPERHLAYGRRLIGLGQLVPPQVYLDLGRAFLSAGAIDDAVKTFRLARDLPDPAQFQRETALLYEENRYPEQALETYAKVLIGDTGDVGLLLKVAELRERLGRDEQAWPLYRSAMELLLDRRPVISGKEEEAEGDAFSRWFARNVDDYDRFAERTLEGLLVTSDAARADALLEHHAALLAEERAAAQAARAPGEEPLPLARHPRLLRRSEFVRRFANAFGRSELAFGLDLELLAAFPADGALLEQVVRPWVRGGRVGAARRLIAQSGRDEAEQRRLAFLVGGAVEPSATDLVPLEESLWLLLPLLTHGKTDDVRELLRRVDYQSIEDRDEAAAAIGSLFSAARSTDDPNLCLFVARHWLRAWMKPGSAVSSWALAQVMERVLPALEGEALRGFCQYFVQLVLDDPEKRGECLRLLPQMQEELGEPLLDAERISDILAEHADRLAYYLGPLLDLVPEGERASIAAAAWGEVMPTSRPWFLINLVRESREPFGEELHALFLEWWDEALAEKQDYLVFQFDGLMQDEVLEDAAGVVEAMLDAYERLEPQRLALKAVRIKFLQSTGREQEAVDQLLELYFRPDVLDDSAPDASRIRRTAEYDFFELAPDAFLARFDQLDAEEGADFARTEQRLRLVQRLRDPQRMLAEVEAALERHPEDEAQLLGRLRGVLLQLGEGERAREVFERMLAAQPEDQGLAAQEIALWNDQRHPLRADEALGRLLELRAAAGEEEAVEQAEDEAVDLREPAAGIGQLRSALDEGRRADARRVLRQLWREFPVGMDQGAYSWRWVDGALGFWPVDQEEPSDEERAAAEAEREHRRRGGLDAYAEEAPASRERVQAWTVLAAEDFGLEEMERLLRVVDLEQVGELEPVLDGLAAARLAAGGEAAFEALVERTLAGEASKAEHLQLLSLLEERAAELGDRADAVLDALQASLHPRDARQLLRLARVLAAAGDRARAIDLYRWCATMATASNYNRFGGDFGELPLGQLVAEVKEALAGGEDLVGLVEDALRFAAPSRYEWEQDAYDLLVLDTWSGMLGAAEALPHCAEVCSTADSRDKPLRRTVARRAAALYARAGELERALSCFEAGYCAFEEGDFQRGIYGSSRNLYRQQGLGVAAWRQFLPAAGEDWTDHRGWTAAFGAALLDWAGAGRLDRASAAEGAALAAWRLHQDGDAAGATALLARLAAMDDLPSDTRLWIADAQRRCGDAPAADAVEAALLAARSLPTARVAGVVRAAAAAEGAPAALALAEELRGYTLEPAFLDAVVELAEAAGDAEAAAAWRRIARRAAAAQARVEAFLEAEAEED